MYSNLILLLGQDFNTEKHLKLLNIYEDLISEIQLLYKKDDKEILPSINLAVKKVNSIKNLNEDEQNVLNSLNYELLKVSKTKEISIDAIDLEEYEKNVPNYYEEALNSHKMPLTLTELKRIINYNYNKHVCENKEFTKDEVDKYFSFLIRSKKEYGISLSVPKELIKEGITVLTKSFLLENKINCDVKWENLEPRIGGHFVKDTITFNENKIRGIMRYDIDLINTMFHEITHANQELNIHDDFLEEIIEGKDMAIFMNSHGITKDINYNLVSYETSARLKGMINTIKYIEKIAPEVVEDYIDEANRIIKREKRNIKVMDRLLYKEASDVHEAFDYCPNSYKRQVIKMFPKLELEYNDDGTRKNLNEMLDELKRQEQYYKEATTIEDKRMRQKYINTLGILLKNRKTKTIQSIKDYRTMQKLIKENKIEKNPITFIDIKKSFNREKVIIKSKISSLLKPNDINNIKLKQSKNIERIYNEIKTK